MKRWGRHDEVDPCRWDEVGEGLRKLANCRQMQLQPIDEHRWRKAVLAKPTRTATGPDGVGKIDLALTPSDLLQALLDFPIMQSKAVSGPHRPSQGLLWR